MAASLTDKITDVRNAARPNAARVTVARTSAGDTLSCNSLTGWPTASKVHFVTYAIDTNNDPVPGSQLDCYGIVSANDITSVTVLDGTDNGNAVGEVVQMLPTAGWGQDLADALTVAHNRDGTPKSGVTYPASTFVTPTIASFTNATHSHTNAAGGGTLGAAAVPSLDYSVQTIYNPYKFSAYLNFNSSYTSDDVIIYNAELFDTSSNYDTSNGKFTAPVTGYYQINASAGMIINGNANTGYQVYLRKNGSSIIAVGVRHVNMYTGAYSLCMVVSKLLLLTAGDYIQVCASGAGGAGANTLNGNTTADTYFEAYLVSRT